MSRCLNKATLNGYLGADPEIRTIPGGARVAQFSLGTTRAVERLQRSPAGEDAVGPASSVRASK